MWTKHDIQKMPAFFDRYILQCGEEDIYKALEKSAHFCDDNLKSKLYELGDRVYAPGKWTIKQAIIHITDNERIQSYRALRFGRNDTSNLVGYDENLLAANCLSESRTLDDVIAEFKVVRQATIALYKSLNEEAMHREGAAYMGDISVLALGFMMVGHQIHHLKVISERYLPLLNDVL